MPSETLPLTHDLLEDVLLAHERRKNIGTLSTVVSRIGPAVEAFRLAGLVGRTFVVSEGAVIMEAIGNCLRSRTNIYLNQRKTGFAPAERPLQNGRDPGWTEFGLSFQKAIQNAGFPVSFAQSLVGSVIELKRNIHEHSGRAATGVIGYAVSTDGVEFVVADAGVGVHATIRQAYSSLKDSGDALKAALSDGYSRYGTGSGRGVGFRELFITLASHSAELRFRSDDQVLQVNGPSPALVNGRLHLRRRVAGFSVSCLCAPPGK